VDHIQGLSKAKSLLKTPIYAHPKAVKPLETGDRLRTFAHIEPQNIDLAMPPVKIDHTIDDGDIIEVGNLKLETWLTPGHTDSQLSFRMGNILFSGDNIYRDGCVGAIDAHHGSDMALPQPRTDLPQGQQTARRHHQAPQRLPEHGRLGHVRDALAADGGMGNRGRSGEVAQIVFDRAKRKPEALGFVRWTVALSALELTDYVPAHF
jgi:glyoxylase-like metal-dependent hydrolase (beta-lactamase superfamily II)